MIKSKRLLAAGLAASLVLAPTEAWSIYAGTPARKLKDRKRDLLALVEEYLQTET